MKPDARNARTAPQHFALWYDALEQLLRMHLQSHEQLLACIDKKKHAIRDADMQAITAICTHEQAIAQQLAECEKRRLELLGRFTEALDPRASRPLTVTEIATTAPEPQQTRILALAAQLRDILHNVKRESVVVRAASEALARHMSGVLQTVHSALSRARVYGSRGTIALGAAVHSSLDLKS